MATIPKIRAGNKFDYIWAIQRNGVAEDLTTATDIKLSYSIGKMCETSTEIQFEIVDGNKIRSEHLYDITGTYNLQLSYTKDGKPNIIDVDAFTIVPRSDLADDSTLFAVTSDMAIGFKGEKMTFSDLTTEDIAELQQPATEASETLTQAVNIKLVEADTVIQNADAKASLANDAASLAIEVANNPDKVVADYWHKWNATTKQYENTGIRATGLSAYEIYFATTTDNPKLTETEWGN